MNVPTFLARTAQALLLGALAGCATAPPPAPMAAPLAEAAPQPTACPQGLPAATRCLGGQDSAGAFYLIAVPQQWNQRLVLHVHGGPLLGALRPERVVEDLQRWSIMVKAGYAWAGSSFRQGGVAVRAAAEDTERLRRIFISHVAKPQRTVLHGQSWGASVAAKGAEMFTASAQGKPYDAVLLTSGVLGGGTRSYGFRLDLRVIGGGNGFGNIGAVYKGSADDAALNAAVQRYAADALAVKTFGEDTDPTGRIPVPVLAVHALHDPIAFVELQHQFRQTMRQAGTADHLVQTFTEDTEHSCLSDPLYPALMRQLLAWVEQGSKPTQLSVAEACTAAQSTYGPGCRMVVGFEPLPLDSRVAPRQRP